MAGARQCGNCGTIAATGGIFCAMCGTPVAATPPQDMRKHVVVLFADLADSTSLGESFDPEPLRAILSRYFETCSACILEHGGLIEKFIGDAIMAVFGVPTAHEDDALRALRSASGMLSVVAQLSAELRTTHGVALGVRIGICSGEVAVTLFGNGDFRVVGDVVNTASRLQSAAPVGGVLVSEQAAWMAQRRATFEPAGHIRLKGKSAPVRAWSLCSLDDKDDGADSPDDGAFVGRQPQLDALERCYRSSAQRQECVVVTVVGVPGIGKSRLIREFLKKIDGERPRVVSGHCRAYGHGATFQPIVEMVNSLPGGAVAARRALSLGPDGERAWECLAALDGPGTRPGGGHAGIEEIGWSFRLLLGAIARQHPLIVIWDDLHWAEPALLALIEDCARWLTGAATLMICLRRPQVPEPQASRRGLTMELGPLSEPETAKLVAAIAPGDGPDAGSRREIVTMAEGNPLFAELMLDMAGRHDRDRRRDHQVPPGIIALLTARLDVLPARDRDLLQRSATIGRYFTWEHLGVLMDSHETDAAERMRHLIRARFIRRDAASGAYCFTHALIVDTAYAMTPKSLRERWHLRLADWLDGRLQEEGGDMLVHHLETASLLRRELRPGTAQTTDLSRRAALALMGRGTIALGRRDLSAAVGMLERSRDLLPPGDEEHCPLALRISDCWLSGGEPARAIAALELAAELLGRASTPTPSPAPTPALLACLEIQRQLVWLRTGQATPEDVTTTLADLAGGLGAGPGTELTWCRLHYVRAFLHVAAERIAAAEQALADGLGSARVIHDEYEEERMLAGMCELTLWGRTTASAGLALCQEAAARFAANRQLLVPTLLAKAGLLTLTGQAAGAEEALGQALGYVKDLHLTMSTAIATQVSGLVLFLAGRYADAEAQFRTGAAHLTAAGRTQGAQTLLAYAARSAFEQGRSDAAADLLDGMRQEADDVRTGLVTGTLQARMASQRGDHDLAVRLAEAASTLARRTDDPWLHGDVLWDHARVLAAARRPADARTMAAAAIGRYAAKEAHLLAGRASRWLSDLAAVTEAKAVRQ